MPKNLFFAVLKAFFAPNRGKDSVRNLINARSLDSDFFKTFWLINLYYNNNERKHVV